MEEAILIIGVGNEYRSDDGAGLAVARRLQQMRLPHVRIMESTGDGLKLLAAWNTAGATRVIIIDAVTSGAPPGTIHRFVLPSEMLSLHCTFQSTHTFGLGEALSLAQVLHQLPSSLLLYAIEAQHFATGTGLSPAVQEAVHKVVERVQQDLI
ncbi:MAG: hydrogenase maturation protease [Ktedonobacteraceae bacterium]|nr:hydrogenase maturation protease [Ktedonobacteraceae bacterium]